MSKPAIIHMILVISIILTASCSTAHITPEPTPDPWDGMAPQDREIEVAYATWVAIYPYIGSGEPVLPVLHTIFQKYDLFEMSTFGFWCEDPIWYSRDGDIYAMPELLGASTDDWYNFCSSVTTEIASRKANSEESPSSPTTNSAPTKLPPPPEVNSPIVTERTFSKFTINIPEGWSVGDYDSSYATFSNETVNTWLSVELFDGEFSLESLEQMAKQQEDVHKFSECESDGLEPLDFDAEGLRQLSISRSCLNHSTDAYDMPFWVMGHSLFEVNGGVFYVLEHWYGVLEIIALSPDSEEAQEKMDAHLRSVGELLFSLRPNNTARSAPQMIGNKTCDIKGNISVDTGERIYHMPGQDYYDKTTIDTRYGERWFCTEAEAIAAGWRKSKQ